MEMKGTRQPLEGRLQETIIDFLIYLPIFDGLRADELQTVAGHMNIFEMKQGEVLFREGEKGDYVCFVVEGVLDVIKTTEKGSQVVIASLPKGRSLGEMALIDRTPRSATIRAKSDALLITLNRTSFDSILESHPAIGIKILKALSRLLSMNMRKTSSRLADYLLPLG